MKSNENQVFRMVSVGLAHWLRGYTHAIDACKILKDEGLEFTYQIFGSANSIEYKYQLYDLDLDGTVVLQKSQNNEMLRSVIQTSDLLVVPHIGGDLAHMITEAIELGTLVLCSTFEGYPSYIIHNKNGFLFPTRDTKSLANVIRDIMHLDVASRNFIIHEAQKTLLK